MSCFKREIFSKFRMMSLSFVFSFIDGEIKVIKMDNQIHFLGAGVEGGW